MSIHLGIVPQEVALPRPSLNEKACIGMDLLDFDFLWTAKYDGMAWGCYRRHLL